MKTEILDNYIEVTTEAIDWVMLWAEHRVTPHVLKWHGEAKGEELEQRLSELSTESIEAEIYKNSTPTDLRDYALIFYKKLNDKGALFKFEFEDKSFNYEREYIKCIDNLLEKTTTFTLAPCAEKPNDYKPLYLSCPYNFKFRKFRYKRPGLITKAEARAITSCIDNIVTYVYQNSEELVRIFKEDFGLKEKENAENCDKPLANIPDENKIAPSNNLMNYIIFKRKKDFSTLFQTIIDDRITDGLIRASVTYIIYESPLFNRRQYHEWRPFYEQFCKDIGWNITSYKPCRLKSTIFDLKSKRLWIDAIK